MAKCLDVKRRGAKGMEMVASIERKRKASKRGDGNVGNWSLGTVDSFSCCLKPRMFFPIPSNDQNTWLVDVMKVTH